MKNRAFGKQSWRPSALGFGTMRLPCIGDDRGQIDEAQATHMLHYAIEHGVNYVDTAYPYHEQRSELFLGRALRGGYRERVRIATKMPTWLMEKAADFDRYLDEQLTRLQTERVEFYLLHGLNQERWPQVRNLDVLSWAEDAIADGRIGHLGFSFHDSHEVFTEIVDAHDWTLCQIQYNFMDVDYQAGTKGLKYAADKGMAVVVMEPIRGGRLANKIPASVQAIWDAAPTRRSPADAALQWVWNQPEVSLVLSGMSTTEQVEQNVASAQNSGIGTLSPGELAVYDRVRQEYERISPIRCTDCKYCLPCPSGVNIPRVLEIYDDLMMYGDDTWANWAYNILLPEDARGNMCIDCGECLEKCPQKIEIPDWLAQIHKTLCQEEHPAL
jgi:predicted aldo/keto reductase-like oxidoreductase